MCAQCAFHPNVETEVSCVECGRPICPKDMVPGPVGYKCPVCAKPMRSEYVIVKPKQLAGAVGFGVLAGIGGGILLGFLPFTFFLLTAAWGAGVGEAVRRGSGGHRTPVVTAIAAVCVLIGALLGGLGLFGAVLGVVGVFFTLGWGWGR